MMGEGDGEKSYVSVPSFSGAREEYEGWLKEVNMWMMTTPVVPEKRAVVLVQRLKGRAKEIAMELEVKDLMSKTKIERVSLPAGIDVEENAGGLYILFVR